MAVVKTNNDILVFGGGDEKEILAWNVLNGDKEFEVFPKEHTKPITCIATCDGEGDELIVITGSNDCTIRSWSYSSKMVLVNKFNCKVPNDHKKEITSIVVIPQREKPGHWLISVSLDNRCNVWDLSN